MGGCWKDPKSFLITPSQCFDVMKLHIWHVLQLSEKGKRSAYTLVPEGFYMISEHYDS